MKKSLSLLIALCLVFGVFAGATAYADEAEKPVVYFTDDISPEGLVAVYEALNWKPTGPVAVKLSTGEPPYSNYLRPELIADLVHLVDGTIVECNTAYAGFRAATAEHYQVAEDHGYTEIADFQIMDEYGSMEIPVTGGTRLTGDLVGEHFKDYGSYIVLSHFKGHAMAGYGGAIKNASIGLASAMGKVRIHSGGTSDTHWHDELTVTATATPRNPTSTTSASWPPPIRSRWIRPAWTLYGKQTGTRSSCTGLTNLKGSIPWSTRTRSASAAAAILWWISGKTRANAASGRTAGRRFG